MLATTQIQKPIMGWFGNFKNKISKAFQGLASNLPNPLKNLLGINDAVKDKLHLAAFRDQYYKDITLLQQKDSPDYVSLMKSKSDTFRNFINQIIAEEVKRLGQPPCQFSLVGLGSLARKECGPVTDLEIGFCLKEKTMESYKYFYTLSQRLADRLFLLGEHPDLGEKGLRLDEADNAPPYLKFFARNATPEIAQKLLQEAIENREFDKIPFAGSRAFIGTPADFASYADPKFTQNTHGLRQEKDKLIAKYIDGKKLSKEEKNTRLFWINQMTRPFSAREKRVAQSFGTQLGRNTTHLYGDRALHQRFLQMREKHLSKKQAGSALTERQMIAHKQLKEDISQHIQKGSSLFLEGKLGKTLDIKREFYRFAEQFVTNLGFYYKTHNQNTFDVVNELMARGIVATDTGAMLKDYLQFAMGLRLKQQSILRRQGFATYLSEEKFIKDKEEFEEKITGLKQSIQYMEQAKTDASVIDAKKRQLFKLEHDYEHMSEMRPGHILSATDIKQLEEKYAPMAKAIFEQAKAWVSDPNILRAVVQKDQRRMKKTATQSPDNAIKKAYLRLHDIDDLLRRAKRLKVPQLDPVLLPMWIKEQEKGKGAVAVQKFRESKTKIADYNARRAAPAA